jgi:stage IV sporulation protein FB
MIGFTVNVRVKRIIVSIDISIAIVFIIALIFGFFIQYLMTIAFIIIHELSHMLVALISGGRIYSLRILPVGLNAQIDDSRLSKYRKILIYMAGPCINLIFALIIYLISANYFVSAELALGVYINIWLALFNLLPVLPLDGGKITMELLANRYGLFGAYKKMYIVSFLLSAGIIILGLVIFINSLYNVSLILVGIYILLCTKESRRETALLNIKNFVFKRSQITKKGVYPVREIVVLKNVKLAEAIKAFDHENVFHIVNVLDDDLRVVKVLTEQQILDALLMNSVDSTFDELLDALKE